MMTQWFTGCPVFKYSCFTWKGLGLSAFCRGLVVDYGMYFPSSSAVKVRFSGITEIITISVDLQVGMAHSLVKWLFIGATMQSSAAQTVRSHRLEGQVCSENRAVSLKSQLH